MKNMVVPLLQQTVDITDVYMPDFSLQSANLAIMLHLQCLYLSMQAAEASP